MKKIDRRALLQQGAISFASLAGLHALRRTASAALAKQAKFTMDLRCGSIGVSADQREAIRLAHAHGFESVTPDAGFLADLSEGQREELLQDMRDKKLVWGAAGLPVDLRGDVRTFDEGLRRLPCLAKGLKQAGVTRVGTWISPSHAELTYRANFRRHVERVGACGKILGDHGLRFGLEYIGPKTLWASSRHSFIHSMAEAKELIAEIGLSNIGFVLDSWHWYTAHESVEDLLTLKNSDIVACDLNDAPAGIPIDEQIDNRRELPMATGVIDLQKFLSALVDIGYDGPIRAEPFNRALNELDNEAAVAATAQAMRKAFALVHAAPA